jgi:hypothetical protein
LKLHQQDLVKFFFAMKKLIFVCVFLVAFVCVVQAQTKVSGVVLDENNEPIPFANVLFVNTKIGVTTDIDGKFNLKSDKDFTAIEVSYTGYTDRIVNLSGNAVDNLRVKLKNGQQLKEVVIVTRPKKHLSKKENPAYRILQGIWAHKKKNGLQLVNAYEYKKYTSVAIGLSNLDSVFLKKTMAKQYDSIVKIIKSGKKDKRFFVPIYMKENYESVYGNNKLKKVRTDMEAERNVGVSQYGFLFDRISNTFTDVNVYQDDIEILNKTFVSPISTRGYGIYDYVLKDSIVENNVKSYQIYFFPRQEGTIAFEGSFKVVDKSFALTEVTMRVNKNINLNLVRNLSVEKNFKIVDDTIFLPERDFYEGDFTLFTKNDQEKGLFVRKNIVFSEYDLDPSRADDFYELKINQIRRDQFEQKEEFWDKIVTKDPNLGGTRKIIGELKDNPRVKSVSTAITIISTGYFDLFKDVQFGSLWQTISNNNVEGLRLSAGLRSFRTPDDRFRAKVYTAYGTLDTKVKYGGEMKYLIAQDPRIVLGITHVNDNIQLGGQSMQVTDLITSANETNLLIARGTNYFLSRIVKNTLYFDLALHNNLHLTVTGVHRYIRSAAPEYFSINYSYDNGTTVRSTITDFAANIGLTYTPKRVIYGFGVEQRFGATLYPTYVLKYTRGINGFLGSELQYNKLQASVSRPIFVSNFGVFKPYLEVGKSFEALPLPLLFPVAANQSFSVDSRTFCLLDYYDMVTDTYIMGSFQHHFNGYIFNKIPGLKKLKLREIGFYRAIYGSISADNIAVNQTNIQYVAPNRAVYAEYGFGIENIGYGNFRPLRFDFVWRTNFQNVNGPEPPRFGVRIGFNPSF